MGNKEATSKKLKILIACEESQVITREFRALGHEAYSCDVKECSGGHPEWHIKTDVRNILTDGWDLMIAHPVCKRLANSGVRWLHVPPKGKTIEEMREELIKGAEFYKLLRDAPIPKKAIENPIMHKYARDLIKPGFRQVVQPWWFGDKAFKATGFELINLPELKPTNKLTPPEKGTEEYKRWSFIHLMPPGPKREELRSKTFPGIGKAVAQQWGGNNG
jgi:hypothetical protein